MERKIAATHRKSADASSQLPITNVTHKAGVVGDALVRAVLAALDMAAERGCATGLDRRHDLQLGEAHVPGVGLSPRRPVGAKDIGDLEARPRHAAVVRRAAFFRQLDVQPVQRTLDVADRVDGDAGVERGRLQLGVPEQDLDDANVDALFGRWVAKLWR